MASVGSSNITFASLRTAYNSGGEDDATGDANLQSGSIKLADFRGAGFTDDSSIPTSGSISVNDDFSGKTFGSAGPIEYTTDTFRAKSDDYSSFPSKLIGTTGNSAYVGSTTANKNVQLNSSNGSHAYSSLLLVHVDSNGDDKFLNVDRSDTNNCIDGAEVWFKVRAHNPHNTVQFGLIKKDFDQSWDNQISSTAMRSRHGAYGDRLSFHGGGFHTYPGSRDDIVLTDTIVAPAWTENNESIISEDNYGNPSDRTTITYNQVSSQGITTNFHNIIGITAGTHKTSNAQRTDAGWNVGGTNVTSQFLRERHFFKSWPTFMVYNYPGYRGTGPGGDGRSEVSLNCNHGLKIKWYEKTLDVYVTSGSPYLIPQIGTWTNNTDSSTGLEGIFSGMYVTAQSGTGTISTSTTSDSGTHINVFIGEIYNNIMTMYQERGASSLTTINGVTSGNATITIGGYLYWTLVTPHDTTSNTVFSNTNYNNPKIIGPPHTVLPRWHVSTPGTVSQAYKTKEWAFYIGDTTSSSSNYFKYHLRNTLPGGTAFSYSVTYSATPLFEDIKSLAVSLNSLTVTSSSNIDTAVSTIHSARSTFNVFAVVGYNDISELLSPQSHNYSTNNRPTTQIDSTKFIYNSSNNYLGYGGTIENMSGLGTWIPSADGKKWMAMAMYTTGGVFRGILIWVFTGALLNSSGSVVSGTMNVTTVRSIFNPDGAANTYRQFYPVVISTTGGLYNYSGASNNGWNFANGSLIGTNGYYSLSGSRLFSQDDGSWGFKIGDQVDGNNPGAYLRDGTSSNPSYGIENPNAGDAQTKHYWHYTGGTVNGSNGYYTGSDYVGLVFSGDYN
jgi:hypothetical protein